MVLQVEISTFWIGTGGETMDEIINEKLGAWLLREGNTREVLSNQLGMTRPTLSSRLKEGGWSWLEVKQIAKLTGATANELAGDS